MNPYTHQVFLFVANAERGALGQFMRDNGDLLGGFVGGDDAEMAACSQTGQGPPDGWVLASWVTDDQAIAFSTVAWPVSTSITAHPIGVAPSIDSWLGSLPTPMVRIIEEE